MYQYNLPYEGEFALDKTFVGQCFRWKIETEDSCTGIMGEDWYRIFKRKGFLEIQTTKSAEEVFFRKAFDLDTNFGELENRIQEDKTVSFFWEKARGIRILKQPLFETMISFILSANNNIPRITGSIEKISSLYGREKIAGEGIYHSFPKPEELARGTEEELKACGLGYRAQYVSLLSQKVAKGELLLEEIEKMPYDEAKRLLLLQKGIGEKVANCILLFGLHHTEAFPVDTWIKKVLEEYRYPSLKSKIEEKTQFLMNRYGEYAGYVQQAMFYMKKWGK